jgi:hypothetical protein
VSCSNCGTELNYRCCEAVEPHGERFFDQWYECPVCGNAFSEEELRAVEREEEQKDEHNSQGQSLNTLDKVRQFGAAILINLIIVRKKCPQDHYRHIDLNAGSGWNDDFDCPGSPLVAVQLLEENLSRWDATFYEINPDRATKLWRRLRGIPHCTVEQFDNKVFLERSLKIIKPWDVGSVLVDPNGWLYRNKSTGIGCPVEEMIQFFRSHRRMDLIANLNLQFYKKARGAEKKLPSHPTYPYMHGPEELPLLFHKRYGLISKRSQNGHSTFVRLILRNIPTGDWRRFDWHQLDSAVAKEIYHYAETTAAERSGQLPLDLEESND